MQSLTIELSIFQLIIVSLRRNVEYYSALKKENSIAQCNKDEAWGCCTKWSEEAQKEKQCLIPLVWGSEGNQIRGRELKSGCQGLGGAGSGELVFIGYRVSVFWEE